jgi:tetratricopeptide (TPR) repeat protein
MRRIAALLLIVMGAAHLAVAQSALPKATMDSLWSVWNNPKEADTNRLKAIHEMAWTGYMYIVPDSTIILANLELEFARARTLERWAANALSTLGVVHTVVGMPEKAIEYQQQALEIRRKIGHAKGEAASLVNLGIAYSDMGNTSEAMRHYQLGHAKYVEIDNKQGIANALGNIGIIYSDQGNHAKAIEAFTSSLKIKEKINDQAGISTTLNHIGTVYHEMNDLPKAIEYYERSVNAISRDNDPLGVAYGLNNLGSAYLDNHDLPKAVRIYRESLGLIRSVGDKQSEAEAMNNLGIALSRSGEKDSARFYYEGSLAIRKEINDRSGMSASLHNLAQLLYDVGQIQRSTELEIEALQLAQETGMSTNIRDIAKSLVKNYKALDQPAKALEMHELYIQMRDSILSEENQKEVMRQQFQYDYEKKEALAAAEQAKKDAIAAEQLKRKNQQRNAFIGGFALTLGLAGVSYRSYRRKKRDNAVITRQKEEVEHKNTEILASITYARRLQEAVLPPPKVVREFFNDSFLLYLPRDIVSGDFYWMESTSPTPPEEGLRTPISELADRTAPWASTASTAP